ncbi:hypothetical protein KCU87_g25, partial [Aureobasidium melanogenum]
LVCSVDPREKRVKTIAICAMEPVFREVYLVLAATIRCGPAQVIFAFSMFRSFSYVTFRTQVSISFLTGGAYGIHREAGSCRLSVDVPLFPKRLCLFINYTLLLAAVGDSGVCSGDSNHLSGFLLRVEKGANRVFALRTFGGHNAVKQESNDLFVRPFDLLIARSLTFFLSLAPLMKVLRSPTGSWKGKSRAASMMAKKIHQPHMSVTKVSAPAASKVPVSTGQTAKCEDQGEEDHGEDDVDEEEGYCENVNELTRCVTGWRGWLRRHHVDTHLANRTKNHQKTTKEETCCQWNSPGKKRLQRTYSGIFSNSSGEIEMLPAYFQLECAISARYLLTIEVLLDWRTRLVDMWMKQERDDCYHNRGRLHIYLPQGGSIRTVALWKSHTPLNSRTPLKATPDAPIRARTDGHARWLTRTRRTRCVCDTDKPMVTHNVAGSIRTCGYLSSHRIV